LKAVELSPADTEPADRALELEYDGSWLQQISHYQAQLTTVIHLMI